jgi:hypothetical protein
MTAMHLDDSLEDPNSVPYTKEGIIATVGGPLEGSGTCG